MRNFVAVVFFVMALLLVFVPPSNAQVRGGGRPPGGGHPGGRPPGGGHPGGGHGGAWHGGGGWHGSGWYGGVFIGAPWWYPYPYSYSYPYPYPYGYYPYPYAPAPYYAYPPPVVEGPSVYIERAPAPSAEPAQTYWYYCASAKAYYPSVQTCREAWIKVPPRPQ